MAQDPNSYLLDGASLDKLREMWKWYERQARNAHPPRYRRPRALQIATGIITFTLAGTLATTDASQANCTVNLVWYGPNPGTTVTVYNELGFSGASGNKGYAVYDNTNQQWKIWQLKC